MLRIILCCTVIFTIFFSNFIHSQTAMVGCNGVATTLTQCGGTFVDPGGAGNYLDNSICTETICSNTPGQCVTLQFTSVNLENSFDYLRIYDGLTVGGTLLATITGTTFTGNVTSTSGCLTLAFTSDGSVTSTGWNANVICAPCGSPPPPPPGPIVASDCSGAVNICTNASFQIDPSGSGAVVEFTTGAGSSISNPQINPGSANDGCMLSGELNSTWMIVNIASSGTLEFSFGANGGINCLDWIMWPYAGPIACNNIINNTLAPVRCNWNFPCESFTGIGTPLPVGGEAGNFEPELNVTCGQRFLICLSNYSSASTPLPLNFSGTASISCSTFTPVTVTSATICPGFPATITASGATTYTWSPGGMTGASITVSPAVTTNYTVTGVGPCGTGTAISTVTVLAANNPLCLVSCPVTATNTGPYCVGGTVQLNGTGGGTYSWSGPNGFTSTLQNPTVAATAAAAGVYTLTITVGTCTNIATTTVVINPVAIANANIDQVVCVGGFVTLAGVISGGAATGTWSAPSGTFSLATNLSSTYTPSIATGTVTLTLTSNDPAGPCPAVTDIMIVTVNPLPIVGAGADQTVCAGVAVTLSGSGASTYTWNNGVTNGLAFTPTASTTYTVTGTSALGCINTDQVTVTVNPLPVLSAGPDASICTGGSTTLTANGATSYSWAPGGQITASITVSPVATATYTVTGTSLGCSASDAVTVTILPNASINAGLDVPICLGASTTLTATGGVSYTWDNGLLLGNNFVVSPALTTTYNVVGTNAAGCVGTDAITVIVNPNPAPVITGASTYCPGSFSLLATTTPFTTYAWSTGAVTPTINATQVDSPVTVTVTNAFGCQTTTPVFLVSENNSVTVNSTVTICQGQSSLIHGINETVAGVYSQTTLLVAGCDSISNVTLVVNPLPIVNAGLDQVYCGATNTTLNGSGAATYTWNNGVTNGVSFSQAVGTLTYTVTGTSAAGCSSTDQVNITINPLPIVGAGPDQSICAGTPVTLSGSGASVYTWNNGVTDGQVFTPVSTTTYTVTGTSAAGCTSTDQVIVTVNPIPVVFAGNDVGVCANQTVTLTGTGAATYSWNNGITNGIAFNPPAGTTTYTVTGTSAAGCINTDQVNVTLDAIPVVTFTPDVTFGCVPLIVNFTNTTPNSVDCVWTMSDGTVLTGCTTVTNTFTQAGCYDITLTTTSTNGCVGTFTAIDLVCAEAAPIASFIPSASIISEMNPIVNFINTTTGAINYLWNFGDNTPTSTLVNPTHDYTGDAIGNYIVTLIAYSPAGCVDTAYSTIQIYEDLIFYIPNTFTPDNDDYNPTFQPIFTAGYDPYDYTLLIFNRWGEIVFESHNTEIGWDGTYGSNDEIDLVQDGTYTWKIEFKTTRNDERVMRVGHVNIIR